MSKLQQLSLGPDAEVIGQGMLPFFVSVNADQIQPVLQKHGFENVDPEKWYRCDDFLRVMDDLADLPGVTDNFVSIGMKIVETAIFPPEVEAMSLHQVLENLDTFYRLNNRGSDIGWMKAEIVSDRHVKMHCRIPWPDDYQYGALYGFAKRFVPKGTHFTVKYADLKNRRDNGGEETVYDVIW